MNLSLTRQQCDDIYDSLVHFKVDRELLNKFDTDRPAVIIELTDDESNIVVKALAKRAKNLAEELNRRINWGATYGE